MADNELSSALAHRERQMAGTSTAHLRRRTDPNVKYAHPYPHLEKEYTREQCKKLEELFAEADTDGQQVITLDKLKRFSEKKMGRPITHLDAKKIIALGDEDQDKKLSLDEFMRLWLKVAAGQTPSGAGLEAMMDHNGIRPDISTNPNFTDASTKTGSIKNRFEKLAISEDEKKKQEETIWAEHEKEKQRKREEAEKKRKEEERKKAMKDRAAMFNC